jgi:ribosome maturation factor RimP
VSRKTDHTDTTSLENFLRPIVAQFGCDLEDAEIAQAGKRRLLRVLVDRDGGISLDDVAEVTRAISKALDADDIMGGGAYTMEVSSPGVDRPLTQPRHWRRNLTRLVAVTMISGDQVTGRITTVSDETAELDVKGRTRTVTFADVAKAKIQIEFNRPAGKADEAEEAAGEADDEDVLEDHEEEDAGAADGTVEEN